MKKEKTIYKKYFKRPMDFTLSAIALITLSPILLMTSILVRLKLGSPVIFTQERPGLNEKIFKMYKFRTMTDERNEQGELLPDSERLTKFGRILRSTSLDELPELWNILKGDMSIIGPRPLAIQYLPYYSKEEKKRHNVRPGLTGLAQVNGRNTSSWEDRFYYDLEYISNVNFLLDAHIILKTISKVISRADIGERGVDTPTDFHIYRKQQREEEKLK